MSANISSLSNGAACESGKLIIQVVGKDHPDSQRLVFYDETDQELQEALAQQDKPEHQASETFSSVLHVWDWEGQPKRQLWLEIAATEGAPIRIPLLDDVRPTARQQEHQRQYNQIVPVVPMVPLPGSKSFNDMGTPVSLRSGFIYVFYRQALWRELEVQLSADKTSYHDVNLGHYRQGQSFKSGPRKATGQALDDIWLPSQWNNTRQTDLQLCFSEVQLSSARLKRLEQDTSVRSQRCNSPDLRVSQSDFKKMYVGKADGQDMLDAFAAFDMHDSANQTAVSKARLVRLNLGDHAFPVSLTAPQRIREPGYERFLDHPGRYICDLSGQFPVESKQAAQSYLDSCEHIQPQEDTRLLELEAWSSCLTELIATDHPPSVSDNNADESGADPDTDSGVLWEAQDAAVDRLSLARGRQLCGVLLEDHMHRMRHLSSRIGGLQKALALCAQRACQHSNHASALLLQQLMVPRTLNGQINPLHQALQKINEQGKRDINRCTSTPERMMLWLELNNMQNNLSGYLDESEYQQALADHLSLDGFDYLSAIYATSLLLASLAASPAQIDPLAVNTDLTDAFTGISSYNPKASRGQEFISKVASDTQHPLAMMLWPKVDMEALYAPYQAPEQNEENQGDGRFRATGLAQFEAQDTPALKADDTLDSAMLIGLLGRGSLNSSLTAQLKAGASALVSIYESLQGAVTNAQSAVDAANEKAQPAQKDAQTSTQNHAKANAAYEKQRSRLAKQSRQINVRLHGQGLGLMRSTLPATFGGAVFIRKGTPSIEKYYIFGLADLPTDAVSRPSRFYGQFQSADGTLLATTNASQAARSGLTETSDHLLVAMLKTDKTAQMVSELNQQFNKANTAAAQADVSATQALSSKGILQEAVDDLAKQKASKAYKVLNSTPFATGVLMLELWNVRNEWISLESTKAEKGKVRAIFGIAGAGLDLTIAMEALTTKFVSNQSIFASTREVLFTIPEGAVKRVLGLTLSESIVTEFTARLIGQTFAGVIFIGLSLYDAWYGFQWGDDAMWGYLLMAGGATASVLAGLTTAAPILGLNPLGWAALMLIVSGAGVVYWLSSAPIEDWMTNGPFGDNESPTTAYLRDPQEAFYRLLGLFAGIQIQVRQSPDYDPNAKLDAHAEIPYSVSSADTMVRIESSLPGLVNELGSFNFKTESRLRTTTSIPIRTGNRLVSQVGRRISPVAQRVWPNAIDLYFKTPADQRPDLTSLAIKAQLRLIDSHGKPWYFPVPSIRTSLLEVEANNQPDFDNDDQPFWASV